MTNGERAAEIYEKVTPLNVRYEVGVALIAAALDAVRDEAIEEAAGLVDKLVYASISGTKVSDVIRDLKGKPHETK